MKTWRDNLQALIGARRAGGPPEMTHHRDWGGMLIAPGFSRRFALYVLVTHVCAAVAALAPAWGWPSYALCLGVLVSGVHIWVVDVLRRAPWSLRWVYWDSSGSWRIRFVSGQERDAQLSLSSFVTLQLVVLNFRLSPWRRRSLVIFADALDAEQLRRLRQALRASGSARESTPAPS